MTPTIYFLSGKMGSGKTTYAKQLSKQTKAIYLSEDDMLTTFYPNEIHTIADYVTYSRRIKPYVENLIQSLVQADNDIVMDFPGNTIKQRLWFKQLIDSVDVKHQLIFLDESDETCIAQINKRRQEEPNRHEFDTEEMFRKMTYYFEEPTEDEGFSLVILKQPT